MSGQRLFPVEQAHRLEQHAELPRWLVEGLWSEEAVGLVGGEPKVCKSFLALDLAVAVASGTPCLRRFAIPKRGRVLLFAAEDSLPVVRQRLEGISHVAGVPFAQLDVHVITAPTVRLDDPDHVQRLANTVEGLHPRLLVLDPFVRLHRRDENVSAEVAPLLDRLRQMQRQYAVAVLVVHHAKKGSGKTRAGQALRGSSEFHAWADSLLYLRRHDDRLTLSAEHRAGPGIEGIALRLRTDDEHLALQIVEGPSVTESPSPLPVPERIRRVLAAASAPVSLGELREACHLRKATLCEALGELTARAEVLRTEAGRYRLPTPSSP